MMVYAIHEPDEQKLEKVKGEMRELGAPEIRVVDCGDHYQALEGSHRIAAAHALGIMPDWLVYESAEEIDITAYDWYEEHGSISQWAGTHYPAYEVACELFSPRSAVDYAFEAL